MDEHLARALAKAGGLGLGRMLEAKLHARSGGETDAPARVFSPPAAGLGMTRWIPVERPAGEAPRRVARYDPIIARAAGSFNLSPGLLRAVITQESGGKADAVSPKGAKGLMQLMDETARDLGVADPYDPEQNIFGGARYLRQLLNRWRGDLKKALAAYNAGPAAVERHGGVPPYRETRDYVRRVMELMQVSAHANGTAKDRS
ncbi:MAG: lytic transglycosylase domain-containing protein [Candidatus Eisenbacteria sp.]|nr:lytic transglycosylase domain-containing protein [Candidatus Eisenbacteria bacterium]